VPAMRQGGRREQVTSSRARREQNDLRHAGAGYRGEAGYCTATRQALAASATYLPHARRVVLNQNDERTVGMTDPNQRPTTRGRKLKWDFDPPEEYMSQKRQDSEEWDGTCGCSLGPQAKPSRPFSVEDELQYHLWDQQIWCDVQLIKKKDDKGTYTSARLTGPAKEKMLARPIVQQWINKYAEKTL